MLEELAQPKLFSQAFDQLVLTGTKPVIVAVSGGSDSTALLFGLSDYFQQQCLTNEIIAVTIDHGLRPESGKEAERVAKLCHNLGIRHILRKWAGADSLRGIQAAARDARYSLIGQTANEAGAQFVLTGHTLDDQVETVFMRSSRGSGRGLSGIPRATLYDRSIWFVRPLLGTSRADLRAYLSNIGVAWIEDPSNSNSDFERVRVRQQQISDTERVRFLAMQSAAQFAREKAAKAGAELLLDDVRFFYQTDKQLAHLSLGSIEEAGFEPALQTAMSMIGGRSHFASIGTLNLVLDFARCGKNGEKFTAHGCLLAINKGTLAISLEGRASAGRNYCFDYLLPETDIALANAMNVRRNTPIFPTPPIKTASC